MVTPEQLPDEVITALQNSLAAYAGDDNGDGHTVVQVNNYTVTLDGTPSDPNLQTAGSTMMVSDLSAGYSTLWIVSEPDAFLELYGDKVDGDAAVLWRDCPVLTGLDAGTYSTALDIDTDQSGQDLLSDCTVLPLKEGDRTLFDTLTAR